MEKMSSSNGDGVIGGTIFTPSVHIWELPVFYYNEIMVTYPYPFFLVINQLFSCIICTNDCICILTGSPDTIYT